MSRPQCSRHRSAVTGPGGKALEELGRFPAWRRVRIETAGGEEGRHPGSCSYKHVYHVSVISSLIPERGLTSLLNCDHVDRNRCSCLS